MKILIPIDNSEGSELAWQSVTQRCWTADTQLVIVTVVEPLPEYGDCYAEARARTELDCSERHQQFINNKVDQLKSKLPMNQIIGTVVRGGREDVASAIIRVAKILDADLIIIGSHGLTRQQKFLLGSVAKKIVRYAPCSVQIGKQKLYKEKPSKEKECVLVST
jgi:nucleotide-binding universal stress UspA family protein